MTQTTMQAILPAQVLALLIMLTISGTTSSPDMNYRQDWYAAMRKVTPARYRGLLFQARKVYQLCEDESITSLSYNRVCDAFYPFVDCSVDHRYDSTMGAVLRGYAGRLELGLVGDWVNNYEGFSPAGLGPGGGNLDSMIESTLTSLEGYFNSTADQFVLEAKSTIRDISDRILSPGFIEAIDGLSQGTFRRVNVNTSDLRLVFVTIGKTEFNGEKFEERIEEIIHFVKEVLFESITKKLLDKIQDLLQYFKPDVKKFRKTYNKLQGVPKKRGISDCCIVCFTDTVKCNLEYSQVNLFEN